MSRIQPALLVLGLALVAGAAGAQPPVQTPYTPYSSPAVSPYLNLLNRGNPAINYYGIVRPQVQQAQQLQMLQFGLTRTAEAEAATQQELTAPGASSALPATGYTTGFMTYQRYFNTVTTRGR